MQQAIPYKSWPLPCGGGVGGSSATASSLGSPSAVGNKNLKDMVGMVAENAVIVFGRKGCCMSHVVRRLLLALGVNPAVFEIDDKDEVSVLNELELICKAGDIKENLQLPAVFIGGRLFGGLDRVMATHISGELVPLLKDAGALWL